MPNRQARCSMTKFLFRKLEINDEVDFKKLLKDPLADSKTVLRHSSRYILSGKADAEFLGQLILLQI